MTYIATTFAHTLKHIEGQFAPDVPFPYSKVYDMFKFIINKKLSFDIAESILPVIYLYSQMEFESVLNSLEFESYKKEVILKNVSSLKSMFLKINRSKNPLAAEKWIMGNLRPIAIGNIPLQELNAFVRKSLSEGGAK